MVPRCADRETEFTGSVAGVSWAVWLAVPVVATMLVAGWTWLRARPEPTLDATEAIQAHSDYLDALVQTARSKDRGLSEPAPGHHD